MTEPAIICHPRLPNPAGIPIIEPGLAVQTSGATSPRGVAAYFKVAQFLVSSHILSEPRHQSGAVCKTAP